MTSHLFYQTRDRKPLLDRAEGIYMWDVQGKRYIDGSSGAMVSNIGHSNPNVLNAIKTQMEKSTFGYRLHFENEPAEKLAARVAELSPRGHDKIFFVSGGSEAVESAVKLARQCAYAKGQHDKNIVISRSPSYHGATLGALSLTQYEPLNAPFAGMTPEAASISAPQCYLDHDNLSDQERGIKYADMLKRKIIEIGADKTLAFIMEPVGGASTGALVAPDSYYGRIREICDEFGVYLIYDEVMTGVGRTGKFLACEHWNINPDIIATAKGFGAGYIPLGAMSAKDHIVDTVLDDGGFQHGYTYAGNPIACAAGLSVIDEIYRLNLLENTEIMGAKLMDGLTELQEKHGFIGDVRGKGLLTAFEFIQDQDTMAPFPAELNLHSKFVNIAYENGLIVYSRRTRGGTSGDHILVCPPMIVDEKQVNDIISILDDSLHTLKDHLS